MTCGAGNGGWENRLLDYCRCLNRCVFWEENNFGICKVDELPVKS